MLTNVKLFCNNQEKMEKNIFVVVRGEGRGGGRDLSFHLFLYYTHAYPSRLEYISLSLSLSIFLSLSFSLSLNFSLFLSPSVSLSLFYSVSLFPSLPLSPSPYQYYTGLVKQFFSKNDFYSSIY